jgi:hypothetical protein
MSIDSLNELSLFEELAAILRRARGRRESESRHTLFEELAALEKRALVLGASNPTLDRLAETRFLAGILRESVSPSRYSNLRHARQNWSAAKQSGSDRGPTLEPVGRA